MEDLSDQPLITENALQSAINRSTFLNRQNYNKVLREAVKNAERNNKNSKVFY